MNFEHSHPTLLWFILLTAWLLIAAWALWPFTRQRIIDRVPFVLTLGNIPLELGVLVFPKAFPSLTS